MESGELSALFDARRYRELARELGRPKTDEELPKVRLRARLANVRWASLIDVVEAAQALTAAGTDDAPRFTARAIRSLAHAGANERARSMLHDATERWPGDECIGLVTEQLSSGELVANGNEEHEVRLRLNQGRLAEARELLEEVAERRRGPERAWALPLLADVARADRDWALAASAFERIIDDGPEAFDAPLLETCAALCRWANGEVEAAQATLRRVREATTDGRGEQGTAHTWCSDVLDRLDADPTAKAGGPAWVFAAQLDSFPAWAGDLGAGAAAVCARRYADGAFEDEASASEERVSEEHAFDACPTMAALRHALTQRELTCIRIVATPEGVEAALDEGALVVLEEERSTRTGFLVVVGIEPTAGLLLLHDPGRAGAYLTTLAEHESRSGLFGGSGLVVLGRGASALALTGRLAERKIEHDIRFDAVDACDLDERGQAPSRARVDALAQKAIELAPELPAGHRRQGESMLEQLRAGRLAGGRLERWVAVTRERFPHAEWALQIYAEALEIWGRPHEAGIAWADASTLDAWDERNIYGRARAHLRIGEREPAERLLRRTLALRSDHAPAMARWATVLLERGECDRARLSSELAEEIRPEDAEVLHTRATVLERDDRFDEALLRLQRAMVVAPRDTRARARCLQRFFHSGRWQQAEVAATDLVGLDPADALNWADLAFVHYARGEGEAAVETLLAALGRCGPERGLIDESARVMATLLGSEDRAGFVDALAPRLAQSPGTLMDIAVNLVRRRLDEEGAALALRASELMVDDANGPWRAAQTLLAVPAEREQRFGRIEALLAETVERTSGYPHPRVALSLHTYERDPDAALKLLEEADVGAGPVPLWKALSFVCRALGDEKRAKSVEQRLLEVGPDALIEAGTFLRNVGQSAVAQELFEAARERDPEHARSLVESAKTYLRMGDPTRAAAMIERSSEAEVETRVRIAMANADWPKVVQLAGPEVERVTRRSDGDVYDAWVMRARLAGAERALGDEAGVERIEAAAGRHAEALAALATIAARSGAESAESDEHRLRELAPGAWLTFERGGVRW